jgi:hypothetical protein
MNTSDIKRMYKRKCLHDIIVRRYAGANASRTKIDYNCKGHARLYAAQELVGPITQGDERVIALADDLEDAGFVFPLKTSDKVICGARELSIVTSGERRALDGTLIALEIQARG